MVGIDAPKAPVLAGSTLVVEAANHLQTVGVIDLFVRPSGAGPLVFADAGGVARADELLSLAARIRELEARINAARSAKVSLRNLGNVAAASATFAVAPA